MHKEFSCGCDHEHERPHTSGQECGCESENKTPRILSHEEAVQACCFLFELNTRQEDIVEMVQRAGIPLDTSSDEIRDRVFEEWYGFVHAAVVYALMANAPNEVMAEYLRSTRQLLANVAGYSQDRIESFIDNTFSGYLRLMAQNRQKQCPQRFFQRVLGETDITALPPERVAFLSGMMAITMCAILDKLEKIQLVDDNS